jgi:hypothetical protein
MTQFRNLFRETPDDEQTLVVRKDFSAGMNSKMHPADIGPAQASSLTNVELVVPGQTRKRRGTDLVEDLSNDAGTGMLGFDPDGGANVLVATHGAKLETWPGSSTFTERKTDFTTSLQTAIVKAGESGEGDVFLVGNGTDNWFRFEPDNYSSPQDLGNTSGTGSDSPPKSSVGAYYRNRFWVMKSDLLYYSSAYPADYSTAFATATNAYRIPCGTERAIVPLRDSGMILVGENQIWGLNPSVTPAATDKPEKILDLGCVANKSAIQVGDDVYFLGRDGVRGVFRSQQDKLQLGQSYPLSFPLKDEYDSISWGYVHKSCAVFWNNMYLLALPVDSSTYNNEVWVYYPAQQAWTVYTGLNVGAWGKMRVSGQERLYYIDSNDGSVYRAFADTTYEDETADIVYTLIGREEDGGNRMLPKVGGVVEVEAKAGSSADTITVYYSLDGQDFTSLGTMSLLSGVAPVLPIDLPFNLADDYTIRKKFHLTSLGPWKTLRFKIYCSSDVDVVVYGYSLVASARPYFKE